MTDLDPEIWKNPTLGEAGAGPFLDEVEQQALENLRAQQEGREPRIAVHQPRYPQLPPDSVPSHVQTVEFIEPVFSPPVEDESPVEEEFKLPVEEEVTFNVDDFE